MHPAPTAPAGQARGPGRVTSSSNAPMADSLPPVSHSQPAGPADDEDPHASVTLAPPAPSFDELLRRATPRPSMPHSEAHFQRAFDASSRTDLSLSGLSRMVDELSSGVHGARSANAQLLQELATLREMLGTSNEQQLALRHRTTILEQELAQVRQQAEEERAFITEQHDTFIAAMLDEHEEELEQSREERAWTAEHERLMLQRETTRGVLQ